LLTLEDAQTEEKTCYVALSPAKEEKEAQGGARGEEFRLPDGNVIRVSSLFRSIALDYGRS